MPHVDMFILLGIGVMFVLLGLGVILLGIREEKKYYELISSRPDAREFLDGWPKRSQFGSLQLGGWIAIILGILLLIVGVVYAVWG